MRTPRLPLRMRGVFPPERAVEIRASIWWRELERAWDVAFAKWWHEEMRRIEHRILYGDGTAEPRGIFNP